MALQDMIRWLLPREDHYYDMLEELAKLGHSASVELSKFGASPAAEITDSVQKLEHQADDVVRRMEDALARTFVTPLDREDLHKLCGQLDDIIDLTNLTARSFALYHIEKPTKAMTEIMVKLVDATTILRDEVPRLRKHEYTKLLEATREVRRVEKEADTIYRAAISQLFSQEVHQDFRDLLKQKEALDHLENAVDYCDNVADLLSNLAVKHG